MKNLSEDEKEKIKKMIDLENQYSKKKQILKKQIKELDEKRSYLSQTNESGEKEKEMKKLKEEYSILEEEAKKAEFPLKIINYDFNILILNTLSFKDKNGNFFHFSNIKREIDITFFKQQNIESYCPTIWAIAESFANKKEGEKV